MMPGYSWPSSPLPVRTVVSQAVAGEQRAVRDVLVRRQTPGAGDGHGTGGWRVRPAGLVHALGFGPDWALDLPMSAVTDASTWSASLDQVGHRR
jgi:hypothetical protein